MVSDDVFIEKMDELLELLRKHFGIKKLGVETIYLGDQGDLGYGITREKTITKTDYLHPRLPNGKDLDLEREIFEQEHKYKVAKDVCKTCGGYISWDLFDKESHPYPMHIDKDGYLFNEGNCPKFKVSNRK